MLRWLLAISCMWACAGAPARPQPAGPALELVVSLPVETTLHSALPAAQEVWLQMIDGARSSIDFAEFYASNAPNSRLEPVVVAVERAIKRGVRVRFLADAGFTKTYPDTLDRLRKAGAEVRPIEMTGGALHAKYFVVDGRDAYLGSQNFDWRSLEHIVELGVRIHDRAMIGALTAIFDLDWQRAGGTSHALAASTVPLGTALVASPRDLLPPGVPWDLPRLIAMIEHAHASIRVTLLTYVAGDWQELEAALVAAAGRGVTVELLLSSWATREKKLPGLQQLARTPHLAIRIATIPPSSQGDIPYARVLHAKTMVVDGAHAWVGTSNWERGYFYADRNVGVISDDPTFAREVDAFITQLWQSSYAAPLALEGVRELHTL